jgi:hypothetical protein
MISARIDVTKINKKRLFKGEKGTYLDFVLIDTPGNTYGNDYMIVEKISKEEKEKGIKGRILGNAKIIIKHDEASPEVENKVSEQDLPF